MSFIERNLRNIIPSIEMPVIDASWSDLGRGILNEAAQRAMDKEFGSKNTYTHPESTPPQGNTFLPDTAEAELNQNKVEQLDNKNLVASMTMPFGLTQEQMLIGGGIGIAVLALGAFALRS